MYAPTGVTMYTAVAAGLGLALILVMLALRWKWRSIKPEEPRDVQLVHRLCPHDNVVQQFAVEQKDSLDEHLDVLTRKLAEKEGRLRLSKSKIRETQYEIDNLHAIDQDVRSKYRNIMESLRVDLLTNERDCKKIQEQIEWVSRRRAEIKDEVQRGQRLYGEAAAELANNLAELQRGRVTEKCPGQYSSGTIRHRKEPQLPPTIGVGVKTSFTPLGSQITRHNLNEAS